MSRTSIAPVKGREVMRLTEAGIQAMWNEVDSAVENDRAINPKAILDVPENIEPFLSGKCEFQTISHGGLTKRELAERVYKVFKDSGETVQKHLVVLVNVNDRSKLLFQRKEFGDWDQP